jgi:2-amino-4-hydroxy-6-hydroxymethyldihydropteridine diphosphokinase
VRTGLGPDATLAALHRVEDAFGRVRGERNGPRWIDLDLLDYDGIIKYNDNNGISILPHVRLHERAFVLRPLADVAPDWRHPVSQAAVATLIARLPLEQTVALIGD